jgi:IS5 family transposase
MTQESQEALKQAQATRREEYLQRIPIEGKFGQGKNGYRLNYIRAKRADTSVAWINSIFLVMNLLILLRIFFAWMKKGVAVTLALLLRDLKMRFCHRRVRLSRQQHFVSDGNVLTY